MPPSAATNLWLMAAGLACITSASVLRAFAAESVKVDQVSIPLSSGVVVGVLVAVGVLTLCVGHLRGLVSSRGSQLDLRRFMLWVVMLHLLAGTALPLTSNDIFSNLLYGHLHTHEGQNPYLVTPEAMQASPLAQWVGQRWKSTPSVYGPVLAGLSSLSATISGPRNVHVGIVVFKTLMILVSLGMLWLSLRFRRVTCENDRPDLFWLLAVNPVWLVEVTGQAHNDGLMVMVMMAAVMARERGRGTLAAGLFGLAVASKYVAIVPLGFWLLWEILRGPGPVGARVARAAVRGILAGAIVVLCYLPFWDGWGTITRPLAALGSVKFTHSLISAIYWGFFPLGQDVQHTVARVVGVALWVGLLGLTARWVRRWTEDPAQPWSTAMRFTLVHTMIINGYFQTWYLTWLLPLLPGERDRGWWTLYLVWSFFALFHYALNVATQSTIEYAVSAVVIHAVSVVMLVRLLWGKPPLNERGAGLLGDLAKVWR